MPPKRPAPDESKTELGRRVSFKKPNNQHNSKQQPGKGRGKPAGNQRAAPAQQKNKAMTNPNFRRTAEPVEDEEPKGDLWDRVQLPLKNGYRKSDSRGGSEAGSFADRITRPGGGPNDRRGSGGSMGSRISHGPDKGSSGGGYKGNNYRGTGKPAPQIYRPDSPLSRDLPEEDEDIRAARKRKFGSVDSEEHSTDNKKQQKSSDSTVSLTPTSSKAPPVPSNHRNPIPVLRPRTRSRSRSPPPPHAHSHHRRHSYYECPPSPRGPPYRRPYDAYDEGGHRYDSYHPGPPFHRGWESDRDRDYHRDWERDRDRRRDDYLPPPPYRNLPPRPPSVHRSRDISPVPRRMSPHTPVSKPTGPVATSKQPERNSTTRDVATDRGVSDKPETVPAGSHTEVEKGVAKNSEEPSKEPDIQGDNPRRREGGSVDDAETEKVLANLPDPKAFETEVEKTPGKLPDSTASESEKNTPEKPPMTLIAKAPEPEKPESRQPELSVKTNFERRSSTISIDQLKAASPISGKGPSPIQRIPPPTPQKNGAQYPPLIPKNGSPVPRTGAGIQSLIKPLKPLLPPISKDGVQSKQAVASKERSHVGSAEKTPPMNRVLGLPPKPIMSTDNHSKTAPNGSRTHVAIFEQQVDKPSPTSKLEQALASSLAGGKTPVLTSTPSTSSTVSSFIPSGNVGAFASQPSSEQTTMEPMGNSVLSAPTRLKTAPPIHPAPAPATQPAPALKAPSALASPPVQPIPPKPSTVSKITPITPPSNSPEIKIEAASPGSMPRQLALRTTPSPAVLTGSTRSHNSQIANPATSGLHHTTLANHNSTKSQTASASSTIPISAPAPPKAKVSKRYVAGLVTENQGLRQQNEALNEEVSKLKSDLEQAHAKIKALISEKKKWIKEKKTILDALGVGVRIKGEDEEVHEESEIEIKSDSEDGDRDVEMEVDSDE